MPLALSVPDSTLSQTPVSITSAPSPTPQSSNSTRLAGFAVLALCVLTFGGLYLKQQLSSASQKTAGNYTTPADAPPPNLVPPPQAPTPQPTPQETTPQPTPQATGPAPTPAPVIVPPAPKKPPNPRAEPSVPQERKPKIPPPETEAASARINPKTSPPPSIQFASSATEVNKGASVILTWSVSRARSVRLLPPGLPLAPAGSHTAKVDVDQTFTLRVEDLAGAFTDRTLAVRVLPPLEIREFHADPRIASLDTECTLRWVLTRAADVRIELTNKPPGSRAAFLHNSRLASGSVAVRFEKATFTRYGTYEFRLSVRDHDELQETITRIELRKDR